MWFCSNTAQQKFTLLHCTCKTCDELFKIVSVVSLTHSAAEVHVIALFMQNEKNTSACIINNLIVTVEYWFNKPPPVSKFFVSGVETIWSEYKFINWVDEIDLAVQLIKKESLLELFFSSFQVN